MIRKTFSQQRELKGVSTTKMAADLGITESHLRGIERGRNNPTLKLAFQISKYLGSSLEELFGDAS
ncbi:hypothetical protein BVG16_13620 [Paenibacillus selenitireducens]|uniref:HTH cro/C1-type domain-containing protein n=1 Tax=Paenibacillus selenitireducens TaxID=1324314 RepID=A0A1T2XCD4_9BACL|nr:helix-turn-helix transcriptional regulator [Paenibacillus selenitireducens]OPA77488.1 hypothetical protein BVG16_13620 [Paenibacillus selenitireducens]